MEGGTAYLRTLLERYNFDLIKALAAYNAGPQRVEQYRGAPPYHETQADAWRALFETSTAKSWPSRRRWLRQQQRMSIASHRPGCKRLPYPISRRRFRGNAAELDLDGIDVAPTPRVDPHLHVIYLGKAAVRGCAWADVWTEWIENALCFTELFWPYSRSWFICIPDLEELRLDHVLEPGQAIPSLSHILSAIGLIYITYVLRAIRWKIFLRPVRKQASLAGIIPPTVIGFTGLTAPDEPGELIRPYLIARREGLGFSSQMAVWAVERIFDVGGFTVLMILAIFLPTALQTLPSQPCTLGCARADFCGWRW